MTGVEVRGIMGVEVEDSRGNEGRDVEEVR